MTTEINDQQRVESRAEHLLPEERAAGSEDPLAQAEAILADSGQREQADSGQREQADSGQREQADSGQWQSTSTSVAEDAAAPDTIIERRTSDEATAVMEPSD
ncbi:hypothetical protein GCM10027280_24430 [Micromonospora polyrhachis]|uniref:Uncharacterized protein n=1 Tax=Micromonospora polyrhachis TaxID=1282883 RepID=A0A7W7ST43_9ACTN|nr:hypothetical protein [Micromonospora polyrhachis]MBB4960463.1 hypothetical protein [Micromonospora polyrhachis]